jgi:hypothetical protein
MRLLFGKELANAVKGKMPKKHHFINNEIAFWEFYDA